MLEVGGAFADAHFRLEATAFFLASNLKPRTARRKGLSAEGNYPLVSGDRYHGTNCGLWTAKAGTKTLHLRLERELHGF